MNLTQEESSFWNSFSNNKKSYILTGNTAQSLDFTEYQRAGFCVELQPQVDIQEVQDWQEPNLFFDPSSSDSDSSEDLDYVPSALLQTIAGPTTQAHNPLFNHQRQNRQVSNRNQAWIQIVKHLRIVNLKEGQSNQEATPTPGKILQQHCGNHQEKL
jgi:hypothetical protein